MTIRTEIRYYVVCDGGCGTEHHVVDDDSALAARISAGIDGWRHTSAKPGGRGGKGRRLGSDLCRNCAAGAPTGQKETA